MLFGNGLPTATNGLTFHFWCQLQVVTDNTETYYSFGKTGVVPDFQKAAWPALDALDNTPGWDWSMFDRNEDTKLDSVVITHSGYGAETTTTDVYGTGYKNRIWAHAFAQSVESWSSKDGSVTLNGYTVASAFENDSGVTPATIGLTVHEYMHTFDVPDLYDTADPNAASGVGGFDIMANPYGHNGDSNLPGHLSTWSKMEAEWVTPTEITSNGVYTLKPMETTSDCYMIMLGVGFGGAPEYLLFENRQKLEYDVHFYGTGLAIFHINDGANGMENRGYPGQDGWPANNKHYQVAVMGADGYYDLEKGNNKGDEGDLWQQNQELGPGMGGTVFPNTDGYADGWVYETGITIKVLAPEGQNVRFQVRGLADVATPNPTTVPPTHSPTGMPIIAPTVGPTATPSSAPTSTATSITPSLLPSLTATSITPSLFPSLIATSISPSLTATSIAPSTTKAPSDSSLSIAPVSYPTAKGTGPPDNTPGVGVGQRPSAAPNTSPDNTPGVGVGQRPSVAPHTNTGVGKRPTATPSTRPPTTPPFISATITPPTTAPSIPPFISASITPPTTVPTIPPFVSAYIPAASITPRPTTALFATNGKESPAPAAAIPELIDNDLLQPADENDVVATDFDNAPTSPTPASFSVSIDMSSRAPAHNLRPSKSPTPAPFSVGVDMSSHRQPNSGASPSRGAVWFSMIGSISLVFVTQFWG